MQRVAGTGLLLILILLICAAPTSVEARRMSDGSTIRDEYLDPNHPAVALGPPVSRVLMRAYPQEPPEFHCAQIKPDNRPGQVTLQSIYAVAHGAFSADIFGGAISPQELARIQDKNASDAAARVFLNYALRAASGDAAKALGIVKNAERRDADCAMRNARFWRARLDLYNQDLAMFVDADGQWVAGRLRPGTGSKHVVEAAKIINETSWMADRITAGYEASYAILNKLANARSRAATPLSRKNSEAPQREKQVLKDREASHLDPDGPDKSLTPQRAPDSQSSQEKSVDRDQKISIPPKVAAPAVAQPAVFHVNEMKAATSYLKEVAARGIERCVLFAALSECSARY